MFLYNSLVELKSEIELALHLDEPITAETTLEERDMIGMGMREQGASLEAVLTVLGLGIDDDREFYIRVLVPPRAN